MEGITEGSLIRVTVVAPGRVTLDNQEVRSGAENIIRMGPGGTVTGRVVRQGVPVPGVNVEVHRHLPAWYTDEPPPVASIRTDSDGRFTLERLVPGDKMVKVVPENQALRVERMVAVRHDESEGLGDIALASGGSVRARLVREPDRSPVTGVEPRLIHTTPHVSETVGTQSSGADGTALFENVPPGRLSLSAPRYQVNQSFTLAEGEAREIPVRVSGGLLRGQVTWPGEPVPPRLLIESVNRDALSTRPRTLTVPSPWRGFPVERRPSRSFQWRRQESGPATRSKCRPKATPDST